MNDALIRKLHRWTATAFLVSTGVAFVAPVSWQPWIYLPPGLLLAGLALSGTYMLVAAPLRRARARRRQAHEG